MECPKCGFDIDEKATVCPNCKKVLKVICPICKSVNESNTCRKCGYVIITKCHKCGKINQTVSKKCRKCGFKTETSVILNESNSDDFVMLTIDFPNLDEMRTLLGGSIQLLNKFKANLDKIIADYAKSASLRRQVINNTYIIRFNKTYTFNSSAEAAVNGAIEILSKITTMNARLAKRKNASVRCNMFMLKRTVKDDPGNYKSGLNISLLDQAARKKEEKVLSTFQVLTDPYVMSSLERDYDLTPLNSVMVGDEMVMYYELDIKNHIKVEFEEEEVEEVEVPNFVQNMLIEQDKLDGLALNKLEMPEDPDAIYDIETINFNEISCNFQRTENIDVFYHIINRVQTVPKGILTLKTAELYKPYSLKIVTAVESLNVYNNILTLTCYDEMKYSPYSFFRDLVAAIFEYTVSQKLFSENDFSMFKSLDPDGLIKDLITLNHKKVDNPEDTRFVYFDIFLTLLQAIPKTLILIENFEKIDESSYDVMKHLFEAFDNLDVSYLITYDKDFSLHRDCHFLLSKPYYSEINLKPTVFEKLIEENKIYYRNILDNFYFHRIAKYCCGSILFLDIAIQYLIESGVFVATEDSLDMAIPKTIIIPSSLKKLFKRRIDLLQDDEPAIKFLTSAILLGTRIDLLTIKSLGFENVTEIIDRLTQMGYVYFYNNCMYFPNYNLLRESLLESVSPIYLKEVAEDLFDKVMDPSMPSPTKAYLYNLLGNFDAERREWEYLAQVNLSMGDFSAYLNCTNKILDLLNKETEEEKILNNDAYKLQLYENISINMYEYVPDKTSDIAEETLRNLERSTDKDKIIILCNKMIQGCMVAGNYSQALELTHKVLSLLPASSLDPMMPNFNHYYFLMSLVHIQILFNIGALAECLDVGYKVMNVVKDSNIELLRPEYLSNEHFKEIIIDSIGYVALANVLVLSGNVQDFLKLIRAEYSKVPESYDMFVALQNFIHGLPANISAANPSEGDKFAAIGFHVMNAFQSHYNSPALFAEEVYQAKVHAKIFGIHQLEFLCDLLIGSAYMKLESYKKAEDIFFKLIKIANENGMKLLLYSAWYLMSDLSLKRSKYDVAYGIVNNSLIQLERNNTTSEYMLMLFKYNMFKVLMYQQRFDQAEICINQASYIATKYGINFVFDTEPSHYIPVEEVDTAANDMVTQDAPVTAQSSSDESEE